ncbi:MULTISPECIES: DapH/DapD/GlmU-related protein [Citrobacter]|uniref:DapH/DapD/GlmU-related protein n=1 Tax=Citrobacter TaxID=544 RepID=UPI001900008F|nr:MULTISPECIES: DapH/DapD/GlmU-related protein [Citrobacter]MBJ8367347.1 serine acetyltransferase [Citrobacter cronae]MBJ8394521.1 serine acetyltransferase [Citrobacter cronae]MBJ8409112.1 serine acetyltransferase [Citrobacter cronae]MBU5600516.1 serine acetyltransferase [Citrobacter sp. S55_ASV_140]
MKTISIITFLLSKKSKSLKQMWRDEITPKGKITPLRLLIAHRCRTRHFLMWWRLANQMYIHGNKSQKRTAKKINWALQFKYASEIGLRASIGKKPNFVHLTGVVISDAVRIGNNAIIHQNVTIGVRDDDDHSVATIGNNVTIGANSCIIGGVIIGDNVKIGAMSMVLSNIDSDSTYICKIQPVTFQNKCIQN